MNATDPELDGTSLRSLLIKGSDDLPPDIDLLRGVRDRRTVRRRRTRRRMRALVPAGAAVAVGGAAVLATLLATTSVSNAPSALVALTSAVVKTSAERYQFSLNSTTVDRGHGVFSSAVVTGAFDPRRKLGTEVLAMSGRQGPMGAQIRFIGGYVYTRVSPAAEVGSPGKPWDKAPIPPAGADVLPGQDLEGFSAERPVSPAALLGVLRSAATVRVVGPASGPGWTGTEYAFTARVRFEVERIVSGTVYVDQQGRVRRLVTTTSLALRQVVTTTTDVLTFGDFGAPVPVSPPPASQVAYTTTPYWVFAI
jgi:hypothetical protein